MVFTVCLCFAFPANAQQTQRATFSDTVNLNSYFKINLTTLFEFEPALQFAYSYPVKAGRAQLQHEIGYITWNRSYMVSSDRDDISYHGFRIRNHYRHYYLTKQAVERREKEEQDFKRNYFGLDVMYKYGNIWQIYEIDHAGYFESVGMVTHKHVGAVHIMIGRESEFLAGSENILDYYFGFGIRYKGFGSKYDDVVRENDLSPFFYDSISRASLSFVAGVRLGFKL